MERHPSRRVRLAPGTRLDLGGIAKGYILQIVALDLRKRELPALVEAGGDIAVNGPPPGQPGWRIASGDSTILLSRGSLSTSGPQSQYADIGGVRYSHVVDPRTGWALTNGYSATVVHWTGMTADALSTALTVTGPEGLALVRKHYPDAIASVVRR
jgi:thiamine biosynthesis lipoprotein